MKNPWEKLDLAIYEDHMNLDNVAQIPLLNKIMKSQFFTFDVDSIAIWGVAGGNGLEHISFRDFKEIFCIDLNKEYLKKVKKRYSNLDCINIEKLDLNDLSISLHYADIVIANLLIEYMGIKNFIAQIDKNSPKYVSCVIQKNNNNNQNFVSNSPYTNSLKNISKLAISIDKRELIFEMSEIGFECIFDENYSLINNKEFIRLDFNR
jgi:hypothetical protein